MHHFLYKTTCLVSGKFYIGRHSTKNLDDGYLGSGVLLRKSIKKYGRTSHILEILSFFETKELLVVAERNFIDLNLLNHPMCMNLNLGGEGGWTHEMRVAARLKRQSNLKDPKYREALSTKMKKNATCVTQQGRANCSNALKEKYKDADFKSTQTVHAHAANRASWSPEARLKRELNRKNKMAKIAEEMVAMNSLNATKVS